ncbi:MAG TPA: FtsX-like permease family protein [Acidimicrobiales bacterium]|nr:FtsX-like permease family protein [Acidimicrobiales bacterium]
MRARAEMRGRARSAVLLAALIGLAGAVVLTAWAGARRTDSAYARYLASTHAADYLISTGNGGDNTLYHEIEQLPQVERAGIEAGSPLVSKTGGKVDIDMGSYIQSIASEDGRAGYSVGGFKLVSGRLPDPTKPFEAAANETLARRRHLRTGSSFTMYLMSPAAIEAGNPAPPDDQLTPIRFTITGIAVTSDEVVPIATNDGLPSLGLTPAFHQRFDHGQYINFDGMEVRLRPGADRAAFVAGVDRLAASGRGRLDGLFVADLSVHEQRIERAIHPMALALELFAELLALGAALALSQIIAREVTLSAGEDPALRAMGFDRWQLVLVRLVRLCVPVLGGAAIALLGAILASPLMPMGAARLAEPSPGLSVDWAVLGVGCAAMLSVFLLAGLASAWRVTRHASVAADQEVAVRRPSRLVEMLARAGMHPPAVTGVRMALEPGRGRTAVPVRSATAGIVVAVAAVVAVVTFSANLNRLVSTPRLYGDTWSIAMDGQFQTMADPDLMKTISNVPGVDAIAGGTYGDDTTVDGRTVPTVGIDSLRGGLYPTLVSGRRPEGPGEVALGGSTMRSLGKRIGDTVTVVAQGQPHRLTVVGQIVLPSLGRGSFTPTDLGQGAVTDASLVAGPPAGPGRYNFVLLRFAPGVDVAAVTSRVVDLVHRSGCPGDQCLLTTSRILPTDVRSYQRVSATPAVLAALLALLGTAMIGHALVTSVRRRRRDLAVLKTLGFVKREVATAVAWQVSTFALIGLALGVPAGVALGRWLWSLFAHQIGVPPSPVVPILALGVIPGVLLVANLIAALPARSAARTRPAVVLRSE